MSSETNDPGGNTNYTDRTMAFHLDAQKLEREFVGKLNSKHSGIICQVHLHRIGLQNGLP